jgi:large subunit ribosomal protein L25
MANIKSLNAQKREGSGTAAAKKLRRQGRIPGVVYGGNQDNYAVDMDRIEIRDLLASSASENILVRLDIDGAKEQDKLALIQAVQHNVLTSAINHIDFHCVSEDEEIVASVPLQLIGEAAGIKAGGLLDQQLQTLDVRCKPGDLPELLQGDITEVGLGQPFHIGGVTFPEGVSAVLADDVVVAIIAELRAIQTPEEEAADAAAAAPAAATADADA